MNMPSPPTPMKNSPERKFLLSKSGIFGPVVDTVACSLAISLFLGKRDLFIAFGADCDHRGSRWKRLLGKTLYAGRAARLRLGPRRSRTEGNLPRFPSVTS